MYERNRSLEKFQGNPGEQIGLFKVVDKTNNEIVLGEDDKHLDFRISFFIDEISCNEFKITLTALVKFNNKFGRLYFVFVKPFHKLIADEILKRIATKVEDENTILYL